MTNLPVWNLNDFYSDIKSPKIKNDLDSINKLSTSFNKKFKNKLNLLNKSSLENSIEEYEKIQEKIQFIHSFSFLTYCTHQIVTEKAKFFQDIEEKLNKLQINLIFFSIEISNLSNEKLNYLANTKYGSWVNNLVKNKKYQKTESVEKILMQKSITSTSSWIKFFDQFMARLKFNFDGKQLNESEILDLMSSSNSSTRKKSALSFGRTLKENSFYLGSIMNNISKDLDIDKDIRGFKFSESSRHVSNQIDKADVDSLVNTVKINYKLTSHKYYKYKAKFFKTKKLNFWDRNAPYPKTVEKKISWKEARDIVLNSYYDFDPQAGDIAKMFFDKNWIHAPVIKGKMSGAFSHPTVPSCHPYILLNFQGKTRDVMTLAHELGHGIHQYLANKNGLLISDTPLTLAETASVFGEMLTFKFLLKSATSKTDKIFMLRSKIEDMLNTVVRQISFFDFEREIHNLRINGEISVKEIGKIWLKSQKESLGNYVRLDNDYEYFWSYIPHFIHSPFYVYAYAFGDCLVNTLYSRYEEKFPNFNKKYFKLLQSGGSIHYKDSLKDFDLDPSRKDFWELGIKIIKNFIDELEKLS